ncbi:MAG: 3-hydroxyacyl-CoA dehydrogenase family protein [Dehalobacterium sp.]
MFEQWKVTVAGAGLMGHAIAQVFAVNGFETTLYDLTDEQLEKAKNMIAMNLDSLIKLGMATLEDKEKTKKLISYTTNLEQAASKANYIMESVFESADVKRDFYAKLDKVCPKDSIIASTTSAMNIFEVVDISCPERLIITHWFNPAYIMPLVEVVMGPKTSTVTVDTAKSLLEKIGKKPALIKQYIPGFIVNRISSAIVREAGYMIGQGWTTPEDIDAAIVATSGIRYPFEGPLEMHDYVGWDLIHTVNKTLYPQLCHETHGINPLAAGLAEKGHLGVKSGKGIKDYSGKEVSEIHKQRTLKIIKMLKAVKDLENI